MKKRKKKAYEENDAAWHLYEKSSRNQSEKKSNGVERSEIGGRSAPSENENRKWMIGTKKVIEKKKPPHGEKSKKENVTSGYTRPTKSIGGVIEASRENQAEAKWKKRKSKWKSRRNTEKSKPTESKSREKSSKSIRNEMKINQSMKINHQPKIKNQKRRKHQEKYSEEMTSSMAPRK